MSFEAKRKIEVGGEEKKPSVPRTEPFQTLRDQVAQEIKDHHKWCGKTCDTFIPSSYRHARLVRGYDAKTVQDDYDLCHICR